MATQSWILSAENAVLSATETVKSIEKMAKAEFACGAIPTNRDYWGTLAVNLETLTTRCRLATDEIRHLQGR